MQCFCQPLRPMTRYNRRTTRSCHLDSIEKGATAIINGDDPPTRRRRTGDAGGDAQSPLPAQLCRLPLFLACACHRGETRKPEIAEVGKAERDRKSKSLNSSQ